MNEMEELVKVAQETKAELSTAEASIDLFRMRAISAEKQLSDSADGNELAALQKQHTEAMMTISELMAERDAAKRECNELKVTIVS